MPTYDYSWTDLAQASVQRVAVSCGAYRNNELITELAVTGGDVQADGRRGIMRTASITIAPSGSYSLADLYALLPYKDVEIRLARGFRLADGSRVLAPLGVYAIDELTLVRGDPPSLAARLSDLSVRIGEATWTEGYTIAAATNLATALSDLILDRYPAAVIGFTAAEVEATLSAALTIVTRANPWDVARSTATAYGYTLFLDAEGVFRLIPTPDPLTTPVSHTYKRGAEAVIIEETRTVPLATVANGVIVTSQNSSATQVRGEAWDDDPLSPSYRYVIGEHPEELTSSLVRTTAEANAMAAARLRTHLGRVEQIEWTQVPDAALAPFDVVALTDENGALTRHVLDAVSTPLAPGGTQKATVRSVISNGVE